MRRQVDSMLDLFETLYMKIKRCGIYSQLSKVLLITGTYTYIINTWIQYLMGMMIDDH